MDSKTAKAYFGMGCFWDPDDYFSKLDGVVKTTVGYAGGSQKHPTYEDLGDHTETAAIEFDPAKITYDELLAHFWAEHDPLAKTKTQYRSAIFYANDKQKELAEQSKVAQEQKLGQPVTTAIEPLDKFYRAEEYHQQYYEKLRAKGLLS